DACVVVKEEDVLRVCGAPPEVECFRQPEVLRQADVLDVGELAVQLRGAVGGSVIHHNDLQSLALPRRFDGLKARTEQVHPVARDYHYARAQRRFVLFGIGLRRQPPRIAQPWKWSLLTSESKRPVLRTQPRTLRRK